jgi:hypothetical protein
MLSRIAGIVSAGAVLAVLGLGPNECKGWSLLHPFSSDGATETQPKRPAPKPAATPPTTMDKVLAPPKALFTKVGNTITGKKPEPPKPSRMVAIPKGPTIQPRNTETKSWLPSMFQPKPAEKPKDKDVCEWLGRERVEL